MGVDVLTLFPSIFKGPFNESIVERTQKKGIPEPSGSGEEEK